MTELQMTLAVLAVLFIGALYWMGRRRKQAAQVTTDTSETSSPKQETFTPPVPPRDDRQPDLFADTGGEDPLKEENGRLVLELEADEVQLVSPHLPEDSRSNFGRGKEAKPAPQHGNSGEVVLPDSAARTEPRIFAIMVLGTKPYSWQTLRTALVGIGLELDEQERVFVRRNDQGTPYLHVANALEPGLFPITDEEGANFESPGVALILQLPTCVHAPLAMDQMIKDARKLAQRLNAHLYNEKRQRMNESQITALRSAAADYVSEPLQ